MGMIAECHSGSTPSIALSRVLKATWPGCRSTDANTETGMYPKLVAESSSDCRIKAARLALAEIPSQEVKNLAPTIHGLLLPVGAPVVVEKAVTGVVVPVEFVTLAVVLQFLFMEVDLLR